jgi:hypothetical protein
MILTTKGQKRFSKGITKGDFIFVKIIQNEFLAVQTVPLGTTYL